MKRGISTIVAVILVIMMVVAASAVAFYWEMRVQGRIQGGTEQYQETTFERMASTIRVLAPTYYPDIYSLNFSLQNTGASDVPISAVGVDPSSHVTPALMFILKNSNQSVICSSIVPYTDQDNDTISDYTDNCVTNSNPSQKDTDVDGIGDRCDTDMDPQIAITYPFGGSYWFNRTIIINWNGTSAVGLQALPYRYSIDGGDYTDWTANTNYSESDLTYGWHTIYVQARNPTTIKTDLLTFLVNEDDVSDLPGPQNASCAYGCDDSILKINEVAEIHLILGGQCNISAYSDNSAFYFTLSFSGKGSSSGSFKK